MRVLLVEDDDRVAAALGDVLRRHGVLVQRVSSGQEALVPRAVDLVLLDLGLPDMDGLAVCRALRRVVDVPIIAVTARAEERERIAGLRAGADDYVVKPYSSAELLARMEAVLRRSHRAAPSPPVALAEPPAAPVLRHGALEVDPGARRVTLAGGELKLSRKEFDLLVVLAGAQGTVCSRETLLDRVWGATLFGSTRTLDVHVATLRAKLGDPELIETVRGVGYRMRAAVPLP
ncbi:MULTISPECIES: response regulator transcription factor [unclassified Modestobacter]|uniref:response regulator transcription factor n=1 Tax=unclassified Modestobacter TaxID=2643866 RepID=UPI0022AAA48C|nr:MULTISPECIES: response regulator transcription factor [unclassified Modestobacter]MCZ2814321.1 response regulator transcription factor [Modestobacter sp. VKM Ac-2979]MCZ2843987.1 response regulator transcription factor [Modestobacter sp. VKM Ac-2980]MCZ2850665.1 response regulator transcription factor [Modestobacter sp. VKM Ac-2978]